MKNAVNPTPNISSGSTNNSPAPAAPAPAEFEVIAAGLEDKYAGGPAPQASSAPASINPGPAQVIAPKTVEAFLTSILGGMAKTYGDHWEATETDKAILVPTWTSAIDEQAPRWFADSPNKAAWLCFIVTVLWVLARSHSGKRLIDLGASKLLALFPAAVGSATDEK